jgi:hypothetical protein
VRLVFAKDCQIKAFNGVEPTTLATYQPGKWYDVGLKIDVANGRFDVSSWSPSPRSSTACPRPPHGTNVESTFWPQNSN